MISDRLQEAQGAYAESLDIAWRPTRATPRPAATYCTYPASLLSCCRNWVTRTPPMSSALPLRRFDGD